MPKGRIWYNLKILTMAENDLNTNDENKVTDADLDEVEVELTTRADYIQCAYFAISATDDMDTQLMSKEQARKIKRIRRKAIDIIDDCITELHDELYEPEPDEDD